MKTYEKLLMSTNNNYKVLLMSTHNICLHGEIRKILYLEEGLIKIEYIFYKPIINWWSAGFTKPMIDKEILADSQHSGPPFENSARGIVSKLQVTTYLKP